MSRSRTATTTLVVATTLILTGLWLAAYRESPWVAILLAAAGFGLAAVVGIVALGSGYSVVHHAQREAQAIAAIEASRRRRELTR